MAKLTKNQKKVAAQFDLKRMYTLKEGLEVVKASNFAKFDASVDIAVRLGVNPKKPEQMVRGVISLSHGLGKPRRVLVVCSPDKEKEARDAGAEYVGKSYLEKIAQGWGLSEIDVIVATPEMMGELGKLGRILGPRGLMPNPKDQTVTQEVEKTVRTIKAGTVRFKMEDAAIVQASIGRVSFPVGHLYDHAQELLDTLMRLKPATAKGVYIRSISLSSSMGAGVQIQWKAD